MGAITARSDTRRRASGGLLAVPIVAIVIMCVAALLCVTYVLRPRPDFAPVAIDAPPLPIVVAGTLFRVPPRAIRVTTQRRPGTQERLDLAFFWPALTPAAEPSKEDLAAAAGRIFLTVEADYGGLTPVQRLKTIYPRYAAPTTSSGPDGLTVLAFLDETPYQGEDLLFDPSAPERFMVRCTRDKGLAPGSCLYERSVSNASITVRFPRTLIAQWRTFLGGSDRLLAQLQGTGGS
jgi:hypothetical protein